RATVAEVRPDCIWLAETVHRSFAALARRQGFPAMRDTEAYEAFDIEYDYDIREVFDRVLRKEAPLSQWIDLLEYQEAVYPANYNKLRCLENHDQPRIASVIRDEAALISHTALLYFLKGTVLLYAGQEWADTHQPSLFEKETIRRDTGRELSPLLRQLSQIRRERFTADDPFWGEADDAQRIALLRRGAYLGVFPLDAAPGTVRLSERLDVADGSYPELLSGETVEVRGGALSCDGRPRILALG
ncbi:MAG: alpha-amylase, partial [Oscillospiraceae bacterium]|nr:alpha-amylase [Oscillospiraceae bacterium]